MLAGLKLSGLVRSTDGLRAGSRTGPTGEGDGEATELLDTPRELLGTAELLDTAEMLESIELLDTTDANELVEATEALLKGTSMLLEDPKALLDDTG